MRPCNRQRELSPIQPMLQMRTLRPRSLKALGRGHRAGRSPRLHAPSSARTPGHWAPVLVPTSTLHHLKPRFAAPTHEPLEAGTTNPSRQAVAGRSSGYRSGAEGAQGRRPVHPAEAVGVEVQQALPQGGVHGGQRHRILQCAQVLTAPEKVGRAVAAQLHSDYGPSAALGMLAADTMPTHAWRPRLASGPSGGHRRPRSGNKDQSGNGPVFFFFLHYFKTGIAGVGQSGNWVRRTGNWVHLPLRYLPAICFLEVTRLYFIISFFFFHVCSWSYSSRLFCREQSSNSFSGCNSTSLFLRMVSMISRAASWGLS